MLNDKPSSKAILNRKLEEVVRRQCDSFVSDSPLLYDLVCKIADSSIAIWNRLANGKTGTSAVNNIQNNFGEITKEIDLFARQTLSQSVATSAARVAVVTEEDTDIVYPKAYQLIVFVDPLDGSNHVGYQALCGTFFTIVRASGQGNFKPLISGYFLYGYKLVLTLAIGQNLIIGAYDTRTTKFSTISASYQMPDSGRIYSMNDADIHHVPERARHFIDRLRQHGYKSRYSGVLVADLHRILMEGGIFLSPKLATGKTKTKKYFEALAVAHIVEAARGTCVDAYSVTGDILELDQRRDLFSRVPLIFGSKEEVHQYMMTKE